MAGRKIDCFELKQWMDEDRPFALVDVLPKEAFEEMHLPGAQRACVYEMTFLDQVKEAVSDPDAQIVVYGSSQSSRDTVDAVERLEAAGYRNVAALTGGRAAWQQSQLPVEGSRASRPWDPQPVRVLEDRSYAVDAGQSMVEWVGRNVGNRHFGTMRLASGNVSIQQGRLAGGTFDIDMKSMQVGDLEGEMAALLVKHLEHDDFFAVARFPTARLEIVHATRIEGTTLGSPNYKVEGNLTLRDVEGGVMFPALVAPFKEQSVALQAHFDVDRTRWGVNYGSGKLYERLGMHLVDDAISLQVRVIAT
jgi:polyisoprenoid-binding protein YceI